MQAVGRESAPRVLGGRWTGRLLEGPGRERWLEEQAQAHFQQSAFSGGVSRRSGRWSKGLRERGVKAETWTLGWNQEQEDRVGTCRRGRDGDHRRDEVPQDGKERSHCSRSRSGASGEGSEGGSGDIPGGEGSIHYPRPVPRSTWKY